MLDSMSLCCPGARGKCLCDKGPGGPWSPEMGNLIWLPSMRYHGCKIVRDFFFSHPDHFTSFTLLFLFDSSYLMAIGNLRTVLYNLWQRAVLKIGGSCAWLGSDSRRAHAGSDVWALTALIESKPLIGLPFTNWWICRPDLEHFGYTTPITLPYMEV